MTAYQVMPGLTAEEYADLRSDIAAHGIRVPIDVDENGQVLDGHHRSLIAAELRIECPRRVLDGLTESEKITHALAVNVHRRNLTREQRRELLAASIKAEPEASDREHARRVGADHKTAASVRGALESTGEVPQLAERTGADGRTRPARVTQTTRTTEATKVEHDVDLATGEVLPPVDAEPFDYEPEPVVPEPIPAPDPVADYLADDEDVQAALLRKRFWNEYRTASGLTAYDAERVIATLEGWEVEHVTRGLRAVLSWWEKACQPTGNVVRLNRSSR